MNDDSKTDSDAVVRKPDERVSKPSSMLPGWIPQWMGERERAACVLAVGLVLAAIIIAAAILFAFDKIDLPEQ